MIIETERDRIDRHKRTIINNANNSNDPLTLMKFACNLAAGYKVDVNEAAYALFEVMNEKELLVKGE